MAREIAMRLLFLVPPMLISFGIAHAQDSSLPNSAGPIAEPANLPAPNPTGAAPEQNSAVPNTAPQPDAVQHFSSASSYEADTLRNQSAYLDVTVAPFSGINDSGIRFRVNGNADWYRFLIDQNPRILGSGHDLQGGLMAGYNVSLPQFSMTGLVGAAFGNIVNEGVTTNQWGLQAALEMYLTPTDLTVAAASASYSTIANSLQVQGKTGLKIFEGVTIGPEAKFFWQHILPFQITVNPVTNPNVFTTNPTQSQTNVSYMHLGGYSALQIGSGSIAFSGGWARSQQLGSGYYGSVSLYVPF